MKAIPWPTREEWAADQRALYHDRFDGLDFDGRLSAHADLADRQALIYSLQELWRAEGARMRKATKAAGRLARRSDEPDRTYFQRYWKMTPEEQELVSPVSESRFRRASINKIIKQLRDNRLEHACYEREWLLQDASVAKTLTPILASRDAAWRAAEEKRRQEILATPIDDTAWEEELLRRERYRSTPKS